MKQTVTLQHGISVVTDSAKGVRTFTMDRQNWYMLVVETPPIDTADNAHIDVSGGKSYLFCNGNQYPIYPLVLV